MYDIVFSIYKYVIRFCYSLKGKAYYCCGMTDRWIAVRNIHSIMPYTLVGIGGLEVTYEVARQLNKRSIEGDFIELGVARGGCAALMGMVMFNSEEPISKERNLWLFDSFEGLPDPTADDYDVERGESTGEHIHLLTKGSCFGSLQEVRNLMLNVMKFPADRVRFVRGWFQDTIPVHTDSIGEIALLRIDGDWYESTKCCLEGLYSKVVKGGAVIIDDYESCYGCRKAVDEFLIKMRINPSIAFDGRGGCYFFKSS